MRIAFMGTPSFAARSLEKLIEAGHDICCVFSQPDKPKGRGMKMIPTPVKIVAQENAIPVFQPTKLRDGSALELLKSFSPELIAVVAYGRILPSEILEFPKYGCVNIHASLLPKYRGSAPIQWAVLNGDKETGVCSMYMAEGMDTGDIIDTCKTQIGECESFGELYDRLSELGAQLLCDTVENIFNGKVTRVVQNESGATLAPMINKDMSAIDWTKPARDIRNKMLGLDPQPAATGIIEGTRYKLFKPIIKGEKSEEKPGTILSTGKEGICIVCGDGAVVTVTEIQAAGGKRMKVADYVRGHKIGGYFELGEVT